MKNKTLVTYYSRTGTTKRVADKIAQKIDADTDEIIDEKKRAGLWGYLISGRDALFKRKTKIRYKKNPGKYKTIIVGTPVWAGSIPPAIRTYLEENKLGKVAFFCTMGGSGAEKVFSQMTKLSKKPGYLLILKKKEVVSEEDGEKIKEFVEKLK